MLRRAPFTPLQWILFGLNYVIVRILWRVQVCGALPAASGKGAVIVCNHRCPLDPSLLAIVEHKAIHWMVAKEYCEYPPFRGLLRTCEVIPVNRGAADTFAIKEAVRLLGNGELVGMFPEGRINTTEQVLLPGRSGAAMIAIRAGAPIVPCFIHGAPYDNTTLGCLFMPASVRLHIGRPIDTAEYALRADQRQAQDELTLRIMAEIARLGGYADFRPRLAG